jgi:hypothetical protein
MLFPFNDEIVLQASSVWFVVPALCNHIDQQVPSTRFASRPPQRLTAMNAWTEPAGTAVAGSTGAGQLTAIVATHVDEFGGNKYVTFALRTASAGGDPAFTVPVILPWFVK